MKNLPFLMRFPNNLNVLVSLRRINPDPLQEFASQVQA